MRKINFYTGCGLDRMDEKRMDSTWLRAVINSDRCRVLPLRNNKHLVTNSGLPAIFSQNELAQSTAWNAEPVFLGRDNRQQFWFALDLSHLEAARIESLAGPESQWLELRKLSALLDHTLSALLAYARAMILWHSQHAYCSRCGHPTVMQRAGHQRTCTNSACGRPAFPRIDPAVIMLIYTDTHCLLGRQPEWPDGRHSVLAGYVEPGESLEETVAREVQEEVGIGVTDIRYHSSQAWPFPSSIMLGFYAKAIDTEIKLNGNELESAAWFDGNMLEHPGDRFRLPSKDSIAYQLIRDWQNGRIPDSPIIR